MIKTETIENIVKTTDGLELLKAVSELEQERLVFSTSFGAEDQIITDMIFRNNLKIDIFTLDTGRMFPETYSTLSKTIERYKNDIKVYFPVSSDVENLMTQKGPYSFYNSVENRKECCNIRKVEPLKRALTGYSIWITGIRTEHSPNRKDMKKSEFDRINNITKIHPLLDWSNDDVWLYIKKHGIPYNILHDKGFISIGCQPCTRAVHEGEDFRAGRWWWEDASKKECGLHTVNHL